MEKLSDKIWVEIDAAALKQNAAVLKGLGKPGQFLAMVKCNAYGHGLLEATQILRHSADWFGVDTIDEAVALRRAGIVKPILIVTYTPPHRLPLLLRYDVSQAVSDPALLRAMRLHSRRHRLKRQFKIHLKIDTGMSRQGVTVHELGQTLSILKKFADLKEFGGGIFLEGLMTHFATADESRSAQFIRQQKVFSLAVRQVRQAGYRPKYIHANNSAALLQGTNIPDLNLHRAGIGLYGLPPAPRFAKRLRQLGIKPVLAWKTRIIQIKKLPKGAAVGYGATEKLRRASTLAVLPVGYYEGLPRLYSSIGSALVHGQRCRIIGRVSMNLSVIDVTSVRSVPKVWRDEVILIGRQGRDEITADEVARKTRTINYEAVTRINPFIRRVVR